MYRIAVCDDDRWIGAMIERVILDYRKVSLYNLEVDIFLSGEDLCNEMDKDVFYDLIFLDIELIDITGIEVGRILRNQLHNDITKIVFISGKDTYYRDMMSVQPIDFLHKPLTPESIIEKLELGIRLLNKLEPMFEYAKDRCVYKQSVRDILYFEADARKTIMVTVKERVTFYEKLDNIYDQLMQYNFFFSHKSYLVNNIHIRAMRRNEIKMSNGDIIPISRAKQEEIIELQYEYGKVERKWN